MSYQLLPDFQKPLITEHGILYYPYEATDPLILLPSQLGIGKKDDGEIDFSLEFIRGEFPGWPPLPHGRLSFGIEPLYNMESALMWLRQDHPLATLSPARFGAGVVRLIPIGLADDIPVDMLQPTTVRWASAEQMRFQMTMSPGSATLLRKSLESELLPLQAFAELEVEGVSPRLTVEVNFEARTLLDALWQLSSDGQSIARDVIVDYFQQQESTAPIVLSRTLLVTELSDFGEAMADRVGLEFGSYMSTQQIAGSPYLQLHRPDSLTVTNVQWDLTIPQVVQRRIPLLFDLFTVVHEIAIEKGSDTLVVERIVPFLPTGFHQLYISSDLPASIPGLISSGVTIRLPPKPPFRSFEIVEDVEHLEEGEEVNIRIRLSPRETLAYFYSTFLLLARDEGTQTVYGPEIEHQGEIVRLHRNDYSVQIATLFVDASLFALAEIKGRYCWQVDETQHEESFQLISGAQQTTLLLPQKAGQAKIYIEAVSRSTGTKLHLDNLPFENRRLGCYSFPGYGSHQVAIQCHFAESPEGGSLPLADNRQLIVELLPEGTTGQESDISMLYFTPELSQKIWRWFASSPFEAGYRYRTRRLSQQTMSEWSPVQSAFEPLHLRYEDSGGEINMSIPGDSIFEDLIYYREPSDGEHFFYLPGDPSPALDSQGTPLLQLLIAGEMGFLQINTQWHAPSATIESLREKLSAEYFQSQTALPRLSFAPAEVERVDLLLQTENEDKLLGSASSSGSPPFSALFSVRLTEAEQNLVISALHQRQGVLCVRYIATRFVTVEMIVEIEGDVSDAWETLNETTSIEVCQEWVKQAIAAGKLVLFRKDSALATEEFWQHTESLAINQAALWLKSHLQSQSVPSTQAKRSVRTDAQSMLAVSAKLTESRPIPLQRETDIATWFSGSEGDAHIRVVG